MSHNFSEMNTEWQFDTIVGECRELFLNKTRDYGTSWRILRPSSLTDQIWIKAKRIRSIQEVGKQLVNDPIDEDFIGILNYCIITLMQLEFSTYTDEPQMGYELEVDFVMKHYDESVTRIKNLLFAKNHDYGEAWREMRISSMTDIILQKLIRIKSIEDNDGKTVVSEGISAGYQDIVNYAVFCLILMRENNGR